MSTGKQLSFMAGEVSPEYQFNSKEISYATGLKKLYNGYVRKAGGAANRPGFSFLEYNPQINTSANKVHGSAGNTYNNVAIKEQGLGPNITAFSFYNEIDKRWDILELGFFNPAEPTRLYYRYNFTDFALPIAPLDLDFSGSSAATFAVPDLKKFRVVVVEDSVIFFPYVWYQMTVSGLRYPINLSLDRKSVV